MQGETSCPKSFFWCVCCGRASVVAALIPFRLWNMRNLPVCYVNPSTVHHQLAVLCCGYLLAALWSATGMGCGPDAPASLLVV